MKLTSDILNPSQLINFFILLLPISFVAGNAAININIVVIDLLFIFFFGKFYLFFFKNKKNLIIVIFFLLIFFINIFFSVDPKVSFVAFLGLLRYGILLLNIHLLLKFKIINLKNFENIFILIFIFVFLDTIFQYANGYDVFLYPTYGTQPVRLTGPFGNEAVPGGFLVKLTFLFLCSLSTKFHNFKYKNIIFFSILFLIFCTVLTTNERAPAFLLIIGIFFYVLLNSSFGLEKKLFFLLIFAIFAITIIFNNNALKEHYIERTSQQLGFMKSYKSFQYHKRILDSQWGAHYLTAFEIFKDNPILGSGMKTFPSVCSNKKYDKIKSASKNIRCSSHPHNTYLEILYSGGLLFFITFIVIVLLLFRKILSIKSNKKIFLTIAFLVLFFPFQTTGSFYQTWNGLFFVFFLIYLINTCNKSTKLL